MAHIAFVCPPLRGHLDPTLALARRMASRGHRVTLISGDAAVPLAGDRIAVVDPRLPQSGLAMAEEAGRAGIVATVRGMAWRFDALCAVLPGLCKALGVDQLVVDQTEPAGALTALAAGLPYASLASALPLDREPGLPPPFVDWEHRPDGSRHWLYKGGHRVTDWLLRPLHRAIARRASAWGIAGVTRLDDTFSRSLQIFQLVHSLDFPRAAPPPHAHWVGPLRDDESRRFAPQADGRPLAFCSLGTLQGYRGDLFAAMAASLAMNGLRPVVAHGGLLSAQDAAALCGDPIISAFLPQRAVLAQSRLAIIHGGMNTVLDAMAAGVPIIVVPLAYEQGAIAARVAASGAGLVVPLRKIRNGLPTAVKRLLDEPGFSARAAVISRDIVAAGGLGRAADLIESQASSARRPADLSDRP